MHGVYIIVHIYICIYASIGNCHIATFSHRYTRWLWLSPNLAQHPLPHHSLTAQGAFAVLPAAEDIQRVDLMATSFQDITSYIKRQNLTEAVTEQGIDREFHPGTSRDSQKSLSLSHLYVIV